MIVERLGTGSGADLVPVQVETGQVFFQAVGVVRLGFGCARDREQGAAGIILKPFDPLALARQLRGLAASQPPSNGQALRPTN